MPKKFADVEQCLEVKAMLGDGKRFSYVLCGNNKKKFLEEARDIFNKYEGVPSDPPDRYAGVSYTRHRNSVYDLSMEVEELVTRWRDEKVKVTMDEFWTDIEEDPSGLVSVEAGSGNIGIGGRWATY